MIIQKTKQKQKKLGLKKKNVSLTEKRLFIISASRELSTNLADRLSEAVKVIVDQTCWDQSDKSIFKIENSFNAVVHWAIFITWPKVSSSWPDRKSSTEVFFTVEWECAIIWSYQKKKNKRNKLIFELFGKKKKKKKRKGQNPTMYYWPFLLKFPSLRMQTSARNLSRNIRNS